jgi:hypothetical protein
MVPASPVSGSFDWLVNVFKAHQKWKEIDHKTQRLYEQGLALFANHKLKDNARAGSKQISDFTKGFVDAIYAKLLVVEEKDKDGNVVPARTSSLRKCRDGRVQAGLVRRSARPRKEGTGDQSILTNGLKGPRSGPTCTRNTNCDVGRTHRVQGSREKAWV